MKRKIYAAPGKLGRGDGTSPENAAGGLGRALELSREIKEDTLIVLLPGEYRLTSALRLDERDGGTEFTGEGAVVTGAAPVTGWREADDGIVCADVPADARFTQFFVGGERRERARFPESGMLTPGSAPARRSGWANDAPDGRETGNRLLYFDPADIPADLYRPEDIEFIVLQYWMEARLYPERIDREKGEILFRAGSWRPLTWSYGYYLENVREGLCAPGSWYHDRAENRVYYHLKDGESADDLRASYPLLRRLIEISPAEGKTVSGLRFSGITFTGTDGHAGGECYHSVQAELNAPAAVRAVRAENAAFVRCSFSGLGGWALWLGEGCSDDGVERCAFRRCGAGAVRIGEIERPADKAALSEHNAVSNCRIESCGEFYLGSAGIWIGQSGHNTISHNDISGPLQWAVSVGWNWKVFPLNRSRANRIEKNLVHDLGTGVLGTHGAIYALGVSPETVIEGNLIRNVRASDKWGAGEGIILDNSCSGITVQNNIAANAHAGGWGCNFDCFGNVIRNNIFAYGETYQLTRYGDLPDTPDPPPNGEVFSQNIVIYDSGTLFKEGSWSSYRTFWDYNLYWRENGEVGFMNGSFDDWKARGLDAHSLTADPMFADPKNGDFTLPPDSPAFKIGFEPFSLDDVGILPEEEDTDINLQ